MNRDLFGNEIEPPKDSLELELIEYDQFTFEERLARLKYLHRVYPEGYGFLMSMEAAYLFDEARRAFVHGESVGTILLAQAFIEHWLGGQLGGVIKKKKPGLDDILKHLRNEGRVHEWLIEQVDALRKLRNSFVHPKQFDHPHNLSRKIAVEHKSPDEILDKAAKEALAIMYQIARTSL